MLNIKLTETLTLDLSGGFGTVTNVKYEINNAGIHYIKFITGTVSAQSFSLRIFDNKLNTVVKFLRINILVSQVYENTELVEIYL